MKKRFDVSKGNKAYYALVAVCIAAVGTVVTTVIRDYMEDMTKRNIALSEDIMVPKVSMPAITPSATPSASIHVSTQTDKKVVSIPEEKQQEQSTETFGNQFVIVPPVHGEILQSFSDEELVYHKTFEDWRVHQGIDIAAERGEAVKACAKGVVEEIFMDANDGITIILSHGNNYQSVYKNLSTDKMVTKGQTVEKNQTISGVGETGIAESGLPSHLHFELKKNGNFIDPVSYYEE